MRIILFSPKILSSLGILQVIQKSKQWWLVRNNHNEEGNVPQNVLEAMKKTGPMDELPVS